MAEHRYQTKQRREILQFFMENRNRCFSAREVASHVNAGEATVFRTISALADEGILRRFVAGRGDAAFYQYTSGECAEHLHLKCRGCGTLIHMDCGFMEEILSHFRNDHAFEVDCGQTVIYGLCAGCRGVAAR